MLKITVELYPGGDYSRRRVLAYMLIVNIKQWKVNRANYNASYWLGDGQHIKTIHLNGFSRARGLWALIGEIINRYAPVLEER